MECQELLTCSKVSTKAGSRSNVDNAPCRGAVLAAGCNGLLARNQSISVAIEQLCNDTSDSKQQDTRHNDPQHD